MKSQPSRQRTKSITSPFAPQPRQLKTCFAVLMLKRSSPPQTGHGPQRSLPFPFSWSPGARSRPRPSPSAPAQSRHRRWLSFHDPKNRRSRLTVARCTSEPRGCRQRGRADALERHHGVASGQRCAHHAQQHVGSAAMNTPCKTSQPLAGRRGDRREHLVALAALRRFGYIPSRQETRRKPFVVRAPGLEPGGLSVSNDHVPQTCRLVGNASAAREGGVCI